MIKSNPYIILFSLFTILSFKNAFAISNSSRGYFKTKIKSYTNEVNHIAGQATQFQFENSLKFNDNYTLTNQLRANSSTLSDDINSKSETSYKDRFSLIYGENFFKLSTEKLVAQVGYQEVIWGEAFGLNYADFITPKDLRETIYSDVSETRLPILLFNSKYFFTNEFFSGSIQVLFSPEPRFSKQLPIDLFIGDLFPVNSIKVNEEDKKNIFEESEYGGKFSISISGHDIALFAFNYFDRSPYYTVNNLNASLLNLNENHASVQSFGISYAKTISEFVFRSDLIKTANKQINYISGQNLFHDSTDLDEILLSIDTPTYNNYSGLLVFGQSTLSNTKHSFVRDSKEQFLITKLSKTLENDRSLDLSFTREFSSGGNVFQSQLNFPLSNTLELKLGGEFYFGKDTSNLVHLKKLNNIYITLKNFFQI
jgi:hypothetical protein